MERISAELNDKLLLQFIKGLIYCRQTKGTKICYYPSYVHVDFGEDVGGRTDELFITKDHLNSFYFNDKDYQHLDHMVTVFSDNFSVLSYFEERGYTFSHWEHLMLIDLTKACFNSKVKYQIREVRDKKLAAQINYKLSRWAINESQIHDEKLYHYVTRSFGRPIAHGRFSIINGTACFDNIFTAPKHRGKGAATALCTKMILEAKKRGASTGILASSEMGFPLYLKLGFKKIAPIMIFSKKKVSNQTK
ncbi:GNAT superfamily N-acetyltransferase [Scopulibacillus daqui]|uniref:GNAT superfamily N-acetyltransferase n=1 Tax=Scopulibacillus daqui TaxID=1469162 RepID=A0ABS2PXI8_9BACL|nr:GNAT family N-acetyltransferase [Scopulibacillus daqui]MBM7644209.1 GNAT superfamily N-acetyltransferase [Scopulibacillus daqui]